MWHTILDLFGWPHTLNMLLISQRSWEKVNKFKKIRKQYLQICNGISMFILNKNNNQRVCYKFPVMYFIDYYSLFQKTETIYLLFVGVRRCACVREQWAFWTQGHTDVRSQGGLISSAYSQQALCLKQTNTQLSLLSVMALQQPTLQEQSFPKPAAQHNGAKRLWNHRMRTMQPAAQWLVISS